MTFCLSTARRLALAFAALVAISIPALAADTFNVETFSLDNGLEVVVIPNHRAPVVHHSVWYRIGAADEPEGESGVAHFLEHLMFKGTPSVPAGQFSRIVKRHGGNDNAFTTQDYTGYYQTISRDNLELVMKMEADRMHNLLIEPDQVASERDVVLEERRMRTDNQPRAKLSEVMDAVQYLAHPYRLPVIGWAHEIEQLDREKALDFYKRFYAPNNAILVVAGDITAAELKPLAEKYYGPLPKGEVNRRDRVQEPPQYAARRVELADPQVADPQWTRSYLAPSYRTADAGEAEALSVLAQILGGGTTSRLYQALVVDQKLATYAGSWYSPVSYDPTEFSVFVAMQPDTEPGAIDTAVDAEIQRIADQGVTEEELARAKRLMRADTVYAQDSLSELARIFGSALSVGATVEDVQTWPDRVEAVTADQVSAAAAKVLDMNHSVTGVLLPKPAV
ncbi:MAG: peptidase M16 [Rhodospirillaceae bacterium]|nr:peptidase M16 [Rhodospirillaceae bacterium]